MINVAGNEASISGLFGTLLALLLFAEVLQFARLRQRYRLDDEIARSQLKSRMEGYACLGLEHKSKKNKDCSHAELSIDAHQILLGTLKKVEQKNTTLLVVLIFVLGFVLNALSPTDCDLHIAYTAAVAPLSFALSLTFMSMRQVDQVDFDALLESDRVPGMQRELMADLLRKETAFRVAIETTWLTLTIVVSMFVLNALTC